MNAGAPLGIALIAGLSVPGIIFGVPVLVGRYGSECTSEGDESETYSSFTKCPLFGKLWCGYRIHTYCRKVHTRFMHHTKVRRRLITAACVAGSLVVSPVLAVMAVGKGISADFEQTTFGISRRWCAARTPRNS